MTRVQSPINIEKWIEENAEQFKPPVSNRYLYDGRDFFVMVIKGPNARNDFHLVDSEEYFYQLKGDIKVRIREGDRIVDHIVREGETFFIPPNVPHSPQRPPDTIGLVVERRRPPGEKEHDQVLRVVKLRPIAAIREVANQRTQLSNAVVIPHAASVIGLADFLQWISVRSSGFE